MVCFGMFSAFTFNRFDFGRKNNFTLFAVVGIHADNQLVLDLLQEERSLSDYPATRAVIAYRDTLADTTGGR